VLAGRLPTPYGEIDLVAVRGRALVCVEVKTSSIPCCNAAYPRFRPGSRFRATSFRRQVRASRCVAESLAWRGRIEVSLYEVWLHEDGNAHGTWHRHLTSVPRFHARPDERQ